MLADKYIAKVFIAIIYAIAIVMAANALSGWHGFVEVNQDFASSMLKGSNFDLDDDATGVRFGESSAVDPVVRNSTMPSPGSDELLDTMP